MGKINKNYIYIAIVVLIIAGLYITKTKNKDVSLEVIDDNSSFGNIEDQDLTANLLESATEKTAKMMTLEIYLPNSNMIINTEDSCKEVFPVKRTVTETIAPARASLKELFRGPTKEEEKLGFSTSLSKDIKIQKLTIEEGVAIVDINTLNTGEVEMCDVKQAYKELSETLKQFPTVDEVSISINDEDTKSF